MSDWRESLETMADSLDRFRRALIEFDPAATALSPMGLVEAKVSFRGHAEFDLAPDAMDPDTGADLEAEIVAAFNAAASQLSAAAASGFTELVPGLGSEGGQREWPR